MQKGYVQFAMFCFFLVTTASVFAEKEKTAADLWDDYQDASINANTAATKYGNKVDAATEVKKDIENDDKTLSDATQETLKNLFVAGGLYAIGAPTIFIPALGQVKPTLDMVKTWLKDGELEKLKVVAEQAASDAHREVIKKDKKDGESRA